MKTSNAQMDYKNILVFWNMLCYGKKLNLKQSLILKKLFHIVIKFDQQINLKFYRLDSLFSHSLKLTP